MVNVTRTREGITNTLAIFPTIEEAQTFLDRISGEYWGTPGMTAKHSGDRRTLTISAQAIGEPNRILSTYNITN